MPCDWQPTTVNNPNVNIPFDDISAWRFIGELAVSGHPIEVKQLDQPPGDTAYVMIVELEKNRPKLYIKVQLKGGAIFGRSFHYSTI